LFAAFIGGRLHASVVKYSPDGELVEILEDREGKVMRVVTLGHSNKPDLLLIIFFKFLAPGNTLEARGISGPR